MNLHSLKENLRLHLANAMGWTTKRKLVVIESDDWGSIRTQSLEAFEAMKAGGLNVANGHYNYAESLESNADLEALFDTLSAIKDSTGRPAVLTPLCIMGNPDFDRIEASGFSQYHFQPLHQTLREYPAHDRVLQLWREGIANRLFVPQLHGREHINVHRYMQLLQSKDEGFRLAFKHRSIGASAWHDKEYPNYLGALHPSSSDEIPQMHDYLREAADLFQQYTGFGPKVFVAPNAEEPKELESTLTTIGIKYINRAKIRKYPIGDGRFKIEYNWLGKKSEYGAFYLFRNAFFEPVCFGEPDKAHITDWVAQCLKGIEAAFRMKKPAIISSHRVNYIGFLRPANRDKGLKELRRLLNEIVKRWPEVEFLTSEELGAIIEKQSK